MNTNEIYKDDEIDLFEVFKTLWAYRIKILLITLGFVIIGLIYSFVVTPWYKATALVEVGYYKDGEKEIPLANTNDVVEKLKVKYIDLLKEIEDRNEIVKNISEIKGKPSFFKVDVLGKSNEHAINIIKNIVLDVSNEHKNLLNGYLSKKNVELSNIDRQIDYLQNTKTIALKEKIDIIKNMTIPRLDRQIEYFEKTIIPATQRNIDKVDKILLPSIEIKIENLNNDTQEYNKDLEVIKKNEKNISRDDRMFLLSQKTYIYSQISSNKKSLIALEEQKNILISQTKPALEDKLDKLINIDLVNLEENKDKILNTDLIALERELNNLKTIELNKLLDQRSIIELALKSYSYKNTSIVSDIVISKNPEKPKKKLIIAISLITGFMFSIFVVLIYDSINKYKLQNS
ncbi:putative chain length determinant protein, Wzz family [Campylobacter blaseri]|uniref:Chain length determinant protein n=1 Tax=Campylobacter blaseri TaxID=2042961 RepID=A0A2P8R0M7_9BACT|nr:Wzz/FepE/Etk N-terminal domain-containing protein [Campylobacter blaseri]PSM52054.1 chain length determinant protein [Campylobacter blaseri]PSM53839.1 chain length determinant protein [Campylobacter blaseri]QKF85608.1 putative chain length determinant protein, Wzz family [Campylobacter blaseri]